MTIEEYLAGSPLFTFESNLYYQRSFPRSSYFEKAYLGVRQKEYRLYEDKIVANLPNIPVNYSLYREWQARKASSKALQKILQKENFKKVLELGCGNGWFSHQLANALGTDTLGIDVNEKELLQAARVFRHTANLNFLYADIMQVQLPDFFDCIILNSSLQYFSDISKLFETLFSKLRPGGKIYIADSPIYQSTADADLAKQRSMKYFSGMGSEAMGNNYFHHTFDKLKNFEPELVFNEKTLFAKMQRLISPSSIPIFPIISITKI